MFYMIRIVFVAVFAFTASFAYAQVTFVIEQLPAATPTHDSIYVSGTFNEWVLKDPHYMLKRRLDGKLAITIPSGESSFQYKFHRGSWAKVETNDKNEYMPNREFSPGGPDQVSVTISNWQDVGGARKLDVLVFYFFAMAMFAVVTACILSVGKNRRTKLTIAVQIFLSYLALLLTGRVFFEIASLKWQYYGSLAGDVLLFLSGPLWFFTVRSSRVTYRKIIHHSLPAILISCLILLKIINIGWLHFLTLEAIDNITWDAVIFFGVPLLVNAGYFIRGWQLASPYVNRSEHPAEGRFVYHQFLVAGLFVSVLIARAVFLVRDAELTLIFFDRDVIFAASTLFVWMIAYHAFKNEETFRNVPLILKTDDLKEMKAAVHRIMKEKKSFRDPHLTLNDFAEIVQIKPHLLSRVINECYGQNFRDFVNKYRVEEFIELARQDASKRYTFLALANEVGFNSKSTFNAAFKKVTQRSPRDFFKSHKIMTE